MSRNIVIQEGGVGRQLTADRLRTSLVGGGSCLWIPEEDVKLGTKSISENGTFAAADDGLYGYSRVTVRGVGQVVGKNANGNDAVATVDPDTGKIVISELPSVLEVVTPPDKTEYADGDAIDYTGMVVRAYTADGGAWSDEAHPEGDVPASEWLLPAQTASTGAASTESTAKSDFGLNPDPFVFSQSASYVGKWSVGGGAYRSSRDSYSGAAMAKVRIENLYEYVFAAAVPGVVVSGHSEYVYIDRNGNESDIYEPTDTETELTRTYTYDGKTVYYAFTGTHNIANGTNPVFIPNAWVYGTTNIAPQVAWAMIYGDVTTEGTQRVPVQWERPGDGALLEGSFDIHVTARSGDDGDDGDDNGGAGEGAGGGGTEGW